MQITWAQGNMSAIGEDLNMMVTFVDNHDMSRFVGERNSMPALRNALALVLLGAEGIPSM